MVNGFALLVCSDVVVVTFVAQIYLVLVVYHVVLAGLALVICFDLVVVTSVGAQLVHLVWVVYYVEVANTALALVVCLVSVIVKIHL